MARHQPLHHQLLVAGIDERDITSATHQIWRLITEHLAQALQLRTASWVRRPPVGRSAGRRVDAGAENRADSSQQPGLRGQHFLQAQVYAGW